MPMDDDNDLFPHLRKAPVSVTVPAVAPPTASTHDAHQPFTGGDGGGDHQAPPPPVATMDPFAAELAAMDAEDGALEATPPPGRAYDDDNTPTQEDEQQP